MIVHVTAMPPDAVYIGREQLAGRVLACWCPAGEPCHGHTLERIANEHEATHGR